MPHIRPFFRRVRIAVLRLRRWGARWFPLRGSGPLAEPWRRLAAALLDTLLIFLVGVAADIVTFTRLGAPGVNYMSQLAAVLAPLAWLYVLIGWSAGATLGMRALGIRLVRAAEPDTRVGVRCAAVRVLGYWLACLPAKGGLWPILTHPLRQGWHDQLAGTLVIKRNRAGRVQQLFALEAGKRMSRRNPVPGESWPAPDLRLALRGSGYALSAVACLVIGATYPVAWHLRTRLAGAAGDSAIFYWTQWFVPEMAAQRHLPLTHTVYSFYPLDVSLAYTTMDWLNGFVAIPLARFFSPIAVYNLLWLGSLILCAFAAYLLLAAITRSRAAAIAVAPVYGLCPYFLTHGLGHVNLISAEFLPLVALFTYAGLTRHRARYAAAGCAWALAGWCDLQFLLFGALIVAALACAYWWNSLTAWSDPEHRRRGSLQLKQLAVMALCLCAGMSWLIVPLVRAKLLDRGGYTDRSAQYAAMLADYTAPYQLANLSPRQRESPKLLLNLNVEDAVAPGLLIVALAAVAPLAAPKRALYRLQAWWFLLIGAAVLSFGSSLESGAENLGSALNALKLALAFPGNSYALPWHFEGLAGMGIALIGGDLRDASTLMEPVWMPYSWIWTVLPFVRAFRGTARLGSLVDLSAAVIAAITLSIIIARARRRFGASAPALAVIACLAALGTEYVAPPYPTYRPTLSPAIASLRANPGGGPALEIPLSDDPDCLVDQTVHERPIFDGFLSRTPASALREVRGNAFLIFAVRQGDEASIAIGRQPIATSRARLQTGLADLYRIGLRDIILRPKKLTEQARREDEALLARLGAVKTAEDSDGYAEVFHLAHPPVGGQRGEAAAQSLSTRQPR